MLVAAVEEESFTASQRLGGFLRGEGYVSAVEGLDGGLHEKVAKFALIESIKNSLADGLAISVVVHTARTSVPSRGLPSATPFGLAACHKGPKPEPGALRWEGELRILGQYTRLDVGQAADIRVATATVTITLLGIPVLMPSESTEATDAASHVHPRMPLAVTPADWRAWLDPSHQNPDELRALLTTPAAGHLGARAVTTAVNNVRNDGPTSSPSRPTARVPPRAASRQPSHPTRRGCRES